MQRGIHKMRRIHKMRTITLAKECSQNPNPKVKKKLTCMRTEPPKVVSLKLVKLI